MNFRVIAHGSPEYRKTLALRRAILRAPLGLDFSTKEIESESGQIHIAGFASGPLAELIACVVLVDAGEGSVHLRQMAVAESARRRGVGSALLAFAEAHAKSLGKNHIFCHARHYATAFYEKAGYRIAGGPFEEVGLTHFRMEKTLK